MGILPPLLSPTLWERPANVPALSRLLQAYFMKGADQVTAKGHLMPILGIFQKLIASKSNDHEGFYLLESIVQYVPQ
jgi:exportin-2 (importin alpha re-exporter)